MHTETIRNEMVKNPPANLLCGLFTSLSFSFLIWHQFLHLASGHGNSCLSGMIAGVDEMVHLGLNAGPGIE